jgi:Putative bacterial sensory transduction regulator
VRVAIDAALCARMRELVGVYLDGQPVPADISAEPVAIRAGTAVVYVRLVDAEPPVVRVFSPLLRRIERGPDLLGELNDLNARLSFLRVFWRDGTVYAAAELLAETLTEAELANACDGVAETADYYDVRLHARFGGETAYAERRPV